MAATVAESRTEEMRAHMISAQQNEATARGHRVVLCESRHDIHMHFPNLVVAEILSLVRQAQEHV
jgi:hypothetical protein